MNEGDIWRCNWCGRFTKRPCLDDHVCPVETKETEEDEREEERKRLADRAFLATPVQGWPYDGFGT